MATEDNTAVSFSEFKPGIRFYGRTASGTPLTTDPFTINLNAHQSYVIGIDEQFYNGTTPVNDAIGTLITSDKPIAVNTGVWVGSPTGSGADVGIDQTVPEDRLGMEHILMQGAGGNTILESPFVVATANGTGLTVNGAATTCSNGTLLPMNAGEYCRLDGQFSANGNMLVQATQPVYVYQTLAGSTSTASTGMNLIPPVYANSPNAVDNIPNVTYLGSATLGILARNGAWVNVNGAPIGVAPVAVPGTTGWVTYRLTGASGDVSVESDQAIAVQFFTRANGTGAAGYYSGFPLVFQDYGDLPAAYNLTTNDDDGARHANSGLYLGASIDGESDGVESANADGDDLAGTPDDENGVTVPGYWMEGVGGGAIDVTVSGGPGCLSAWLDWDGDDNFTGPYDQIVDMAAVSSGANPLTFDVPAGTTSGQRYTRFRLAPDVGAAGCADDADLALAGLVSGGEVEDHYLLVSTSDTGTGPGGVGLSDGSSALELWLQAGAGTYSDVACTAEANDGDPVACWLDQSGNGWHAGQSTTDQQPILAVDTLNGTPALAFDGSDDEMRGALPDGLSQGNLFIVGNLEATQDGYFEVAPATTTDTGWSLMNDAGQTTLRRILVGPEDTTVAHQAGYHVYSAAAWGSGGTIWVDGGSATTNNTLGSLPTSYNYIVGSLFENTHPGAGNIPEVIVYSGILNTARRIIVENYLSARYDLPVDMDHYDGDTASNGDFDLNVAGIGLEADGDNWAAHSAGIIGRDAGYLQDVGDYLLYGHNTYRSDTTTMDLPTTGDWDGINDLRWARHWYFDRTDVGTATGGLVDLLFDYSEGGMDAPLPGGAVTNYRLLRRADATGQFEDITAACSGGASIVGDQVMFENVDVTCLGSNLTIGTLDDDVSPLGTPTPTAVTLASFTAMPHAGAICLDWETASELDNLGFNLYRQAAGGELVRLNIDLIPGQNPGSPMGAVYTWRDETAAPGVTYFYWLEAVDVYDMATRHGPVSATALHHVYLPLVVH